MSVCPQCLVVSLDPWPDGKLAKDVKYLCYITVAQLHSRATVLLCGARR